MPCGIGFVHEGSPHIVRWRAFRWLIEISSSHATACGHATKVWTVVTFSGLVYTHHGLIERIVRVAALPFARLVLADALPHKAAQTLLAHR